MDTFYCLIDLKCNLSTKMITIQGFGRKGIRLKYLIFNMTSLSKLLICANNFIKCVKLILKVILVTFTHPVLF